ncbi:MAG: hypothetical protein ACFFBV_02370 [Promethearchaeota archaeon]
MTKLKLSSTKQSMIILIVISVSLIFSTIPFKLLNRTVNFNDVSPKISAWWATTNITSVELNNTRHYHNETITIKGDLKYNNGTGVEFMEVAIYADDILYPQFTDITNDSGDFQIDFIIPYSFDVYSISGYKIQVNVTDASRGKVEKNNFLIIFANATSVFDIITADTSPKIPGEDFRIEGFLRYDYMNGTGIPNKQINHHWFNSSYTWPNFSFFTNPLGFFSQDITIPSDAFNQSINLNLSYSGDFGRINKSEVIIPNINLFSDIICNWDIVSNASEGEQITIKGQLISMNDNSLKISNRLLRIRFDGIQIGSVSTDSNGDFIYPYIPTETGNKSIEIEVVNTAGVYLSSVEYISITGTSYTPSTPTEWWEIPGLLFSIIFFPILAVVIAILGVLGYRYYKNQEKESRVVKLPLESKILNFKLLKDSGRLEESISYLFNAIYMDLVNAKYGRSRKENETIRDFAIISVKELKLTPAAMYPFIQKVEEIIYAKPFKITENDFYKTCDLFSPIYFQLTGYNFQLNF